jgi:5-methylcytosine-specific restriction endonuclease McrA
MYDKSAKKRIKNARLNMWTENPCCRECGTLTVLPSQGSEDREDLATVDHLYSRYDVRRYLQTCGPRYRLLCRRCNNRRGCRETGAIPKPEREKRSAIAMRAARILGNSS